MLNYLILHQTAFFDTRKKVYIKIVLWFYLLKSSVYAALHNSSSLYEFERVPKLTNNILAKRNTVQYA